MAVHPLHRFSGVEWKVASQRMVEGDPKRVEVAPRIDGAIHPPGLLRGHVGERSCDELGRLQYLALAWKARRDTKPCEAGVTAFWVDQNVGGLEILVNETALMEAPHGVGYRKRRSQERSDRQTLANHFVERSGRRGLEHQHRLPALAYQLQRTEGPRVIEVILQTILVCQTADRAGRGVFGAGLRHQEFATGAVSHVAPRPAVDALAILPQDVERSVFATAVRRRVGCRRHEM